MFMARRTSWLVVGVLSLSLAACSGDSDEEASKAFCDPICDANACLVCDTSGSSPFSASRSVARGSSARTAHAWSPTPLSVMRATRASTATPVWSPPTCVDFCADGTSLQRGQPTPAIPTRSRRPAIRSAMAARPVTSRWSTRCASRAATTPSTATRTATTRCA